MRSNALRGVAVCMGLLGLLTAEAARADHDRLRARATATGWDGVATSEFEENFAGLTANDHADFVSASAGSSTPTAFATAGFG